MSEAKVCIAAINFTSISLQCTGVVHNRYNDGYATITFHQNVVMDF